MPPRNAAPVTPEERAEKIAKLPAWARDYIGQLESLTRNLAGQLAAAQANAAPEPERAPGLPMPQGDRATARVYAHGDLETPVADLPEGAEVQYGNQLWVRYGLAPNTTSEVLIITGDGDLIVRPVAPYLVQIERG